jgi:hypothetical protein
MYRNTDWRSLCPHREPLLRYGIRRRRCAARCLHASHFESHQLHGVVPNRGRGRGTAGKPNCAGARARSFDSWVFQPANDGSAHNLDVALLWLNTNIAGITPAGIATSYPASNATVVEWGFGCNTTAQAGGGTKRYLEFLYPSSAGNCPGDSGGPARFGSFNASGNIWGVNSGYSGALGTVGNSFWGSAIKLRSKIQAMMLNDTWDYWSEWFPTTLGTASTDGVGEAQVTSPIATAFTGPGNVGVFWIKSDGSIWTKYSGSTSGVWHPGRHEAGYMAQGAATANASPSSRIQALSSAGGQVSLFYVATNGRVRSMRWLSASNSWEAPADRSTAGWASTSASLLTIADNPNNMSVYWIATDGTIRQSYRNTLTSPWVNNVALPGVSGLTSAGSLAGVSANAGETSLFWVGNDGSIQTSFFVSGAWNGPFTLEPAGTASAGGRLTAVSSTSRGVSLFWVGPSGDLRSKYFEPTTNVWSSTFSLSGTSFAAPGAYVAAVSAATRAVSVFVADTTGTLRSTYFDPAVGSWSAMSSLSEPARFTSGQQLAVTSPLSRGVTLHHSNSSGAIWSKYFDPR